MDPLSFRHVLGKGAGSSHDEAQEWLTNVQELGALVPVGPAVFIHRITNGDMSATGILADVSISGYDSGRVKRHEKTLAKTEKKMASYMRTTRIYGNPVALAYRPHQGLDTAIEQATKQEPDYTFVATDETAHAIWTIRSEAAFDLCDTFHDDLYITDGHHRMAAASIVAAEENRPDAHLPAAIFSSDQLRLRSFARCVIDPELNIEEALRALRTRHRLEPVRPDAARPRDRFEFGLMLGEETYLLHLDRAMVPDDLYRALDVNLLQDLILEPVFGITKPRQDKRLHFVPDIAAGERLDCEAWILPYPAAVSDVMAVADMGLTMPPKSTWFGPKIPSGLMMRLSRPTK